MKNIKITRTFLLALTMAAAVGCSAADSGDDGGDPLPPTAGNAELTVVGDSNVFLENGWTHRISVRYHDGDDQALAGRIDFAVVGNSAGGTVSSSFGVTDNNGVVTIDVSAGVTGDASFKIKASAEYATAVEWNIAVSGGTPPLPPLDVTGRYTVHSEFDLVSGLPGAVGTVVNGFIDMTDSPNDPATWLIDLALNEIDNSAILSAINAGRPLIDGLVNDVILSYAPDFVTKILDIGDKFGQVAKHFGTTSTLDVVATGGVEGNELESTHVMTGMLFKIDSNTYTFSMADLGMTNLTANPGTFRMDGETDIYIGQHSFPLSYGSILMVVLENVIIPSIDPTADNLAELLTGLVNCEAVGVEIADFVGFGSENFYNGACELGITAAAGFIEDQIRGLDSTGMELIISGEAKPMDTNTDRKVDTLRSGIWNGNVEYANQPAPLSNSTFRGERQAVP